MSKDIQVSKKQICSDLGVSKNTLDKMIEDGLPVKRIGKSYVASPEQLKKFIESKKN